MAHKQSRKLDYIATTVKDVDGTPESMVEISRQGYMLTAARALNTLNELGDDGILASAEKPAFYSAVSSLWRDWIEMQQASVAVGGWVSIDDTNTMLVGFDELWDYLPLIGFDLAWVAAPDADFEAWMRDPTNLVKFADDPPLYIDLGPADFRAAFDSAYAASSTYRLLAGRRGALDDMSADRGDTSQTLVHGVDERIQLWSTALTANRTVTLSSTNASEGARFLIVRTGTGRFTLDVGGLKTIPVDTKAWVEVVHDGTAWVLTGYGELGSVWDDIQGSVQEAGGVGAVTNEPFNDTPFPAVFMRHDQNDVLYWSFQLPHRWNRGEVRMHVHIVPMANPGVAQVVRFDGDYAWAQPGVAVPAYAAWTAFPAVSHTVNTTDGLKPAIIPLFSTTPTNGRESDILLVRVRRPGAADAADTYTTGKALGTAAANVCILYGDAHYQAEKRGTDAEY